MPCAQALARTPAALQARLALRPDLVVIPRMHPQTSAQMGLRFVQQVAQPKAPHTTRPATTRAKAKAKKQLLV